MSPGRTQWEVARPGRLELPTLCLEGRRSIQLSYGRVGYIDSKSFIAGNGTTLEALTFCRQGRKSVVVSYEHALMNLEHLEAVVPEVPLVFQPIFSVHSVQFGPQGQVGSYESTQGVRCRTTFHNRTSGPCHRTS